MIEFAPTPIVEVCESDLYVAFLLRAAPAGGAASAAAYWNHASGAWESGFDWSKHARALDRLGPVGSPLFNFQTFSVPADVDAPRNVHSLVFQAVAPPTGSTTPTFAGRCAYSGLALRMSSGGVI